MRFPSSVLLIAKSCRWSITCPCLSLLVALEQPLPHGLRIATSCNYITHPYSVPPCCFHCHVPWVRFSPPAGNGTSGDLHCNPARANFTLLGRVAAGHATVSMTVAIAWQLSTNDQSLSTIFSLLLALHRKRNRNRHRNCATLNNWRQYQAARAEAAAANLDGSPKLPPTAGVSLFSAARVVELCDLSWVSLVLQSMSIRSERCCVESVYLCCDVAGF